MGLFDIFKNEHSNEKELQVIHNSFLDDDVLLFCIRYGLSTNKFDYTEYELKRMKLKALEEKANAKEANRDKLNKILNS